MHTFRRWTILWAFSVKQVLEDAKELDPIASELLYQEELAVYKASRKGRQVVVTKLYQLVDEAALPDEATSMMLETIASGVRSSGDCTRIHYQCMPIGVAYACGGFIQIWCYLLPFGAILDFPTENGEWYFLPTPVVGTFIIQLVGIWLAVLMLLGIDEITNQLEHPYHLLPLEALAVTYHRDINRVLQESTDLRLATEAGMRRLEKEAAQSNMDGPNETPSDVPSTPTTAKKGDPLSCTTSQALTIYGPFAMNPRISYLQHLNTLASRKHSPSISTIGVAQERREVPSGESEFDDFIDSSQWKKLSDWRDSVLAEAVQSTGITAGDMPSTSRIPSQVSHGLGQRSFKSAWQPSLPFQSSVVQGLTIQEEIVYQRESWGDDGGGAPVGEVSLIIHDNATTSNATDDGQVAPKP